jgi:hypothetical protein
MSGEVKDYIKVNEAEIVRLIGTNQTILATIGSYSITFGEGRNIAAGTTTGTKIGNATSQKLGFWGKTPIIQPSGATQGTLDAYGTGAFGLDSDARMQALYDLVIAMRTVLVNAGLMKGSA